MVAEACIFVGLIMLVGRWDMAGYYLRFALLAPLALAIAMSFARHRRRPFFPEHCKALLKQRLATLLSLAVFSVMLAVVVSGLSPPQRSADLGFPLREGRFTVGQGGGNMLLNHHAGHQAQRFAVDITAIGPLGFRAAGVLPSNMGRYQVFGKQVVSPCDGTVTAVVDGHRDLPPPKADREHPAGNHVILLCDRLQVELAHLQRGSISVKAGRDIRGGERLGLVGNSGNTTEPHLHIHAVDPQTNKGVAITFGERFPVRNSVFRF